MNHLNSVSSPQKVRRNGTEKSGRGMVGLELVSKLTLFSVIDENILYSPKIVFIESFRLKVLVPRGKDSPKLQCWSNFSTSLYPFMNEVVCHCFFIPKNSRFLIWESFFHWFLTIIFSIPKTINSCNFSNPSSRNKLTYTSNLKTISNFRTVPCCKYE